MVLAADHYQKHVHELEGDINALKLITDLEAEGLEIYRSQIMDLTSSSVSFSNANAPISTTYFKLHNQTLDSQLFSGSDSKIEK